MKQSHPKIEGFMQASKWLSHRALLDPLEMEELASSLPQFLIYNVSELVDLKDAIIPFEQFLSKYIDYAASLRVGLVPDEKRVKPYFSSVFSASDDCLYALEAKGGKFIIKPNRPVVQLSVHHFTFSKEHRAFHSMVHSKRAVTWGIQFAFPQLYSNSITNDVVEVYKNSEFPNTKLFKALAKWMRRQTSPASFKLKDISINATFRLGKACKSWIESHPQLESIGLSI